LARGVDLNEREKMKRDDFFNEPKWKAERRKQGLPYRKPLKTFAELAEMLNVSENKLKSLMGKHKSPDAIVHAKSNTGGQKRYYNVQDFKNWWESLPKEKIVDKPIL
jgi:hypothetical protein